MATLMQTEENHDGVAGVFASSRIPQELRDKIQTVTGNSSYSRAKQVIEKQGIPRPVWFRAWEETYKKCEDLISALQQARSEARQRKKYREPDDPETEKSLRKKDAVVAVGLDDSEDCLADLASAVEDMKRLDMQQSKGKRRRSLSSDRESDRDHLSKSSSKGNLERSREWREMIEISETVPLSQDAISDNSSDESADDSSEAAEARRRRLQLVLPPPLLLRHQAVQARHAAGGPGAATQQWAPYRRDHRPRGLSAPPKSAIVGRGSAVSRQTLYACPGPRHSTPGVCTRRISGFSARRLVTPQARYEPRRGIG